MEASPARVHPAFARATRLIRRWWALAALAGALVVACSAPAAASTRTAHGVLLAVDSPSIQRVDGFTLRTDDGQELTFRTVSDFNAGSGHAMSPGHMRQHMALAEAVTVTYREENGQLVALNATD